MWKNQNGFQLFLEFTLAWTTALRWANELESGRNSRLTISLVSDSVHAAKRARADLILEIVLLANVALTRFNEPLALDEKVQSGVYASAALTTAVVAALGGLRRGPLVCKRLLAPRQLAVFALTADLTFPV